MSEQGQEWTPERVKKLLQASNHGCPVITAELCKIISKTITAALAAERERLIDHRRFPLALLTTLVQNLEKKLVDERQDYITWKLELGQQLAAEREKVRERKAANDVLRDENRGLFAKCQALEEANKKFEIVILEGAETVDSALRAEIKQLRQQLDTQRDHFQRNIDRLSRELAEERAKHETNK
jgi:hypothetical protein